jgi:hypothetical protein
MWISLSGAFLSVVRYVPDSEPVLQRETRQTATPVGDLLLVRARQVSHFNWVKENLLPDLRFVKRPKHDYKYGTLLTREQVKTLLNKQIDEIMYTNFKNSVHDYELHDAYADVWEVMYGLQRN